MASCNGCGALRFERWPKGVLTAKCTDVPARMQHTPGGSRVVDVSAIGRERSIPRPIWCNRKEKQ